MIDGGGNWSILVDGKVVKTIAEAPASQPAWGAWFGEPVK